MSRKQNITIDDTALTVQVERKRVKNVNARLREQTMIVSAPLEMPDSELDPIIVDLGRRLLRRVHARRVNAGEDALALARRVAARFPRPPEVAQAIFVTTQESRWGSYSAATRTIRLNAALRPMPRWVLEAVVAHELAHVAHLDHSPAFWALLRRVCPETDRARAFLAGVSWLGHHWENLPAVERGLLMRSGGCEAEDAE
ncbi:MAG TPA: M48 family metallopeptidase [Herpetosiphonaceae bacterium]|nr:M48 family metallopeptidase [Herpetosiphonaceae bacterium]